MGTRYAPHAAVEDAAIDSIQSVVYVFVRGVNSSQIESFGTGFIISSTEERCLVLTCNHCLKDSEGAQFNPDILRITIRLSGDVNYELAGEMLYVDIDRDLALIQTSRVSRPSLKFAEAGTEEIPNVRSPVVAIGFCVPDRDEDESDEDEDEDEEEKEDDFVFPEEPGIFDGLITSKPELRDDHPMFNEVVKADCGLICGCSGGPLLFDKHVVGVARQVTGQLDIYTTAKTVKAVFQNWLGLAHDDQRNLDELIDYC